MPLRSYKPTSAGRRFMTRSTFEEITTDQPHKPLLEPAKRGSGRNNQGRISVRHRGGGEKRHYRRIDFKRDKWDVPAKVATIEYDPNRSSRIGLLHYADGEKRYIIAPNKLKHAALVAAGKILADMKISQPALGWSHPEWLVEKWRARYGDDKTRRLLEWNNTPPKTFARVNTLVF